MCGVISSGIILCGLNGWSFEECVKWVRSTARGAPAAGTFLTQNLKLSRSCRVIFLSPDSKQTEKNTENLDNSGDKCSETGGVNCHNWGVWNHIIKPKPAHLFICGVTTLGKISLALGVNCGCSTLVLGTHWLIQAYSPAQGLLPNLVARLAALEMAKNTRMREEQLSAGRIETVGYEHFRSQLRSRPRVSQSLATDSVLEPVESLNAVTIAAGQHRKKFRCLMKFMDWNGFGVWWKWTKLT